MCHLTSTRYWGYRILFGTDPEGGWVGKMKNIVSPLAAAGIVRLVSSVSCTAKFMPRSVVTRLPGHGAKKRLAPRRYNPAIPYFHAGLNHHEKTAWYILREQCCSSSRMSQPAADSNDHLVHFFNPILHTWFRDSCFTRDGSSTIQVFPLQVW